MKTGLLEGVATALLLGATAAGAGAASAPEFTLKQMYDGTFKAPPSSAPKAIPGKKVWVISCSQDVSLCAVESQGVAEAAKLLGWTSTVFDGKYDPATWGNGIRQAIAGKYDAIVITGSDCAGIKAPLEEARKAGIKIVAVETADCNVSTPGDKPLFDASVSYVEGDVIDWVKAYGRMQADYLIAKTGGKANAVVFKSDEVLVSKINSESTVDELKRCSGCTVNVVKFSYAQPASELQQLAEQAFLRYGKANSVAVPADSIILTGVGPAVEATGRKMVVMGAEGQDAVLSLIRKGSKQVTAGVGIPSLWEGYAAADALNRVFDGKPAVGSGAGLQVYDKDHNAGKSGGYSSSVDFVADYKKAWAAAR